MRNVFAVFDTEQAYAFRMMEYLNCRKNMPFEVQMFTSAEALISFTGKRHVDLLLVSARAAEDRILQLSVGKIVVLAEGEIDKRLASYPSVCKYQSARQIVREVMDFYSAEKDAAAPVRMMKPNVRRIGVVSTWEPGLRTALAIALGGILAESRSVLYASLDPWSGAADALSGDADRTMSELLYYYRQGKTGLIYLSDTMVRSIRGMHYIPPAAHPGDLMMITDHIKMTGASPMCGPNADDFGPRFFDMTRVYDRSMMAVARECAKRAEIKVHEGVYFFFTGPQFETPAEIRAVRVLGGDAVGMSTVTEVLTAAHCGMPVLGFSMISNMAAGILDQPLSGEEVTEIAEKAGPRFSAYLADVIRSL